MINRITSRENPAVKGVAKLLQNRAQRKKEGLFVSEGFTMLAEALRSGLRPKQVFCLEERLAQLPEGLACPIYAVPAGVLEKLSDVSAPQGVVFTCSIPAEQSTLTGSRFLALDSLRDPGNLGTVLRTADAFGLDGVILLGDCADLWSPKTLRATMGSLFRVPVFRRAPEELAAELRALEVPLFAAVLDAGSKSLLDADLTRACVVIGNEAHGVCQAARDCCDSSLIIPIRSAESLNAAVAAAVFAWEMSRQRERAEG